MMARLTRSAARLRSWPAAGLLALVWLWSAAHPAHAQPSEPMLHEYLAPDTSEDLELSATTPSGQLPAAVRTPSGTITPPDVSRSPEPRRVYRERGSDEATFRPDRDTSRPEMERYDDPFTPALTPFKRLHAFDAVREDYSLYVRGAEGGSRGRYVPLPVGAEPTDAERPGEERFFGDMSVQLLAGQYVRIPTVGPAARLLRLLAAPELPLTTWRDGADNWFVRSERTERVRLVTEIAIARDSFGSSFAEVPWSALPKVPPQPAKHRRAYREVAAAVGISRRMPPADVVSTMVAYFRSFEASDDSPRGRGDIYLDLALSRKGVCRHRAFAFLVTGLNIGLPTRLVHNEAHAWVEVYDSRLWHRIDLGGAATDLAEEPHLDRPPHVPPPDPYAWPTGRDSGEDLAHRRREAALRELLQTQPGTELGSQGASDTTPPPDPELLTPPDGAGGGGAPEPPEDRPPSEVSVDTVDHDIFRGFPLHLQGRVHSAGQPCANLRVDVVVMISKDRRERRVGSLSTNGAGVYDGAVVLPRDLPIGDHELLVRTSGDASCGPGQGW